MHSNPKARYFDGIADQWDDWQDLDLVAQKLAAGLEDIGVTEEETVLDVGCGTGNLTRALLRRLSPRGRVVALDFSAAMVARAKEKIEDERVVWQVAGAASLPLADGSVDRTICYSVWPHFDDPRLVARELFRVVRAGGAVHVWHLASRHTINEIHASAGEAVRHDVLPPAEETARLLKAQGFVPSAVVDDETRYLVSAVKPAK